MIHTDVLPKLEAANAAWGELRSYLDDEPTLRNVARPDEAIFDPVVRAAGGHSSFISNEKHPSEKHPLLVLRRNTLRDQIAGLQTTFRKFETRDNTADNLLRTIRREIQAAFTGMT